MEHIIKCDVCGKVFTYTDKDLKNDTANAVAGFFAGIGGIAAALGGTGMDMVVANQNLDRAERQTVDRNRCPYCNSTKVHELSEEEVRELQNQETHATKQAIAINTNASNEALLKRASLFLEDHEWATAEAYCESVLDVDPEAAQAYLYKLLAENKVGSVNELIASKGDFFASPNYAKYMRFSHDDNIKSLFISHKHTLDKEAAEEHERQEEAQRLNKYNEAKQKKALNELTEMKSALNMFVELGEYQDSAQQAEECRELAVKLEKDAEAARIVSEKKKKKIATIGFIACAAVITITLLFAMIIIPNQKKKSAYRHAIELFNNKDYYAAIEAFEKLGDYKDSAKWIEKTEKDQKYTEAKEFLQLEDYSQAIKRLNTLDGYKDSDELIHQAQQKQTYEEIMTGDMPINSAIEKMKSIEEITTKADKDKVKEWEKLAKCEGRYKGTYQEYVGRIESQRKGKEAYDKNRELEIMIKKGEPYVKNINPTHQYPSDYRINKGKDGFDYSVIYPGGDFLFSADKGFFTNGSTNYYYEHE